MGHHIAGIVASPEVLRSFSQMHCLHQGIHLVDDWAFLPLSASHIDSFLEHPPTGYIEEFIHLSEQLQREFITLSLNGPLVYLETDYFGGNGTQGAVMFEDGQIVCRPASGSIGPINTALAFLGVGLGAEHLCALLADGTVSCWGRNTYGELGLDGVERRDAPTPVAGLANVDLLGVGHWNTCARVRGDGVRCWGGGSGAGRRMERVPTRVEGVDDAADFALGVDRCVLTGARSLHCWGDALMYTYRHADRLGERYRHYTLRALRDLRAVGLGWSAYGAGDQYACALDGGGALWCWGGGYRGDHDRDTGASSEHMVPVNFAGIRDATALAVAGDHACVIREGAKLWCWGANGAGQIGDGTRVSRTMPVEISAHLAVAAVAVAEGHTCAQTRDGALWCWGDNRSGQLGDGTIDARLVPTAVRWREP